MAKQEQNSYVKKLQKDMNTLSDLAKVFEPKNEIGCSGVINTDFDLTEVFESLKEDYDETFNEETPPASSGTINIQDVQPRKIEEPSKKMESYPERTQRKVRLD